MNCWRRRYAAAVFGAHAVWQVSNRRPHADERVASGHGRFTIGLAGVKAMGHDGRRQGSAHMPTAPTGVATERSRLEKGETGKERHATQETAPSGLTGWGP
jgi:hypothetical protein